MRVLSILAIAACAPTTEAPGGPRGLRADQHLDLAEQQEEKASVRWTWPEPTEMTPGETDPLMPRVIRFPVRTAYEHEEHARVHRAHAAGLYAAYDAECGLRPIEEVTISPLERFQIGGYRTSRGAVVILDEAAGPPDEVLALMKCHRAWLMLDSAEVGGPFDVPGLSLDVLDGSGDVMVALSVEEPSWIPELQRRVERQLETRSLAQRNGRAGP